MVNVPAVVMAVRDGRAGLLELTVVVASLLTMHTSTKNAVREIVDDVHNSDTDDR
jgi:hypothetical protein